MFGNEDILNVITWEELIQLTSIQYDLYSYGKEELEHRQTFPQREW